LIAGLGFIALALAVHRPSTPFPGTFALLPVIGGMLVVMSAGASPTRFSGLLSNPVMTYIGRISYPLYLVHWPIHVFSRDELGDGYGLPQRWLMLAGAVALAALLFHFVEEPVRARRVLADRRKLLAAYAGGVACIAAVFVLVRATDGLPTRFPAEVQALAGFANDKSPPLSECQFTGRPLALDAPACRIGDPAAPITWLVYGDSHAWAAHGAMDTWLRRGGKAGVLLYRNSCPPNLGLHVLGDRGNCVGFNDNMVDLLAREKGVSNVFLVSTWLQPVERRLSPEQGVHLDREQSITAFNRAFDELLLRLSAAGKTIYVWEPVPGAKRPVPLALARASFEGTSADLEITRSFHTQQYAFFFEALERNRSRIHGRFSPAAALCGPVSCAVAIDGRPVYFDNSHISRSSAGFWADSMQAAGVVP
jgi:SGNH domain (fused to AT3 domains)